MALLWGSHLTAFQLSWDFQSLSRDANDKWSCWLTACFYYISFRFQFLDFMKRNSKKISKNHIAKEKVTFLCSFSNWRKLNVLLIKRELQTLYHSIVRFLNIIINVASNLPSNLHSYSKRNRFGIFPFSFTFLSL